MKIAIESVIEQTYTNWELILVDDGSTDNTPAIAKRYTNNKKIFLLQHPNGENLGVSKSRSLAIKFAKGEYISFLDADDYYLPSRLEKYMKIFIDYPKVLLVHGPAIFVDNSTTSKKFYNDFTFEIKSTPYNFLELNYLDNNHICNSSVVVKKQFFGKIDNSFSHLFQFEDWITWILLAQYGEYYYLNEILCGYRFHNTSSTHNILTNPLKSLYAKFEMLHILQLRVENAGMKDKITKALDSQLVAIKSFYNVDRNAHINNGEIPLPLPINSIIAALFYKLLNKIK